jgi:hypothetical protein
MDKVTARRRKASRNPAEEALEMTPTGIMAASADDAEQDVFADEDGRDREQEAEEQRRAQLNAFAAGLAKKREAAVQFRRQSGIEDIWTEDEEFYEGIDDANRGESVTLKPRDFGGKGGASVKEGPAGDTGSTVFMNITRPYVDFSAGRAADMLLPTDDRNWDLRPTPMSDVIEAFADQSPMPNPVSGGPATIAEAAKLMVEEAQKKVEKARTRIEDWLEEGQYGAEQRKLLKDAAKLGTGVMKGPFPVKRTARAIIKDPKTGEPKMEVQKKTAPQSKRISCRNLYPDPACGENIHNGNYIWEDDDITARQLRDLVGTKDVDGNPMYLEEAIAECLKEGPARDRLDDQTYQAPDTAVFRIWYYHGVATAEDLACAGVVVDEGDVLPVMVTMVNDRVIKAALSTLDSGEFPYDVMVWQPREGHWAGIGVARQVRAPQRMINAAIRNMLDNAGLGAGPQIVMKKGVIKPAGGGSDYTIRPRKTWFMESDAALDDVNKAFAAIQIPMVTEELQSILQMALKMAEDVTGLPLLMQGQQGSASTTVGGMNILNNNSNTPMRAIAKLFDDRITVPHLIRYYEWLLLHGPEADEKGEFIIAARGSSALFERDAQNQAILAMAPMVMDPNFNMDPAKWIKEAMKAQRLDPAKFLLTDAQIKEREEAMKAAPPPADPRSRQDRCRSARCRGRAHRADHREAHRRGH